MRRKLLIYNSLRCSRVECKQCTNETLIPTTFWSVLAYTNQELEYLAIITSTIWKEGNRKYGCTSRTFDILQCVKLLWYLYHQLNGYFTRNRYTDECTSSFQMYLVNWLAKITTDLIFLSVTGIKCYPFLQALSVILSHVQKNISKIS